MSVLMKLLFGSHFFFLQAHACYLTKKHDLNMFYVLGPGHGAPGHFANLYLEEAFTRYYPFYTHDLKGLEHLIRGFAFPVFFYSFFIFFMLILFFKDSKYPTPTYAHLTIGD